MGVLGYMRYPDIAGESVREGHEDEIEIHAIQFSMEDPSGPTGARRGRVRLQSLTVSKTYDRSSPYLKRALADGRHAREVTITIAAPSADGDEDYLVIGLRDARLTSYAMASSEDGTLQESLTLDYRTIGFVYRDDHEVELDAR